MIKLAIRRVSTPGAKKSAAAPPKVHIRRPAVLSSKLACWSSLGAMRPEILEVSSFEAKQYVSSKLLNFFFVGSRILFDKLAKASHVLDSVGRLPTLPFSYVSPQPIRSSHLKC